MMEGMFCLMVILGSSYTEQQPLLLRAAVEASNALVQCLAPAWLEHLRLCSRSTNVAPNVAGARGSMTDSLERRIRQS